MVHLTGCATHYTCKERVVIRFVALGVRKPAKLRSFIVRGMIKER